MSEKEEDSQPVIEVDKASFFQIAWMNNPLEIGECDYNYLTSGEAEIVRLL